MIMIKYNQTRIPATEVKSLFWVGSTLIDYVSGGKQFYLDGASSNPSMFFRYRFDTVCISPSGDYYLLYERLGTKGVIVQGNKLIREINRSYYCADVYDYPVTIFRLSSGLEVIAHCPEEYNRIEIEEIVTGERLTSSTTRNPADIFHSRLSVNTTGTYLVSAGWVWHPWDVFAVYDVNNVLQNPQQLDEFGEAPRTAAEISQAVFFNENILLLVTSDDSNDEREDNSNDQFWNAGPRSIIRFNINSKEVLSSVTLDEIPGKFYPLNDKYILSFYGNPKIINIHTGKTVQHWPDIECNKIRSSISWADKKAVPIAVDTRNGRFAVVSGTDIVVITLDMTTIEG